MKDPYFEEIEHTADQALRVRGTDFKELLHNAALGMLQLTGVIPRSGPSRDRKIEVQAPDREGLLVTWLEELLYLTETRGVTYTEFELHITDDTHLVAKVQETPIAAITRHIKAVTYHDLEIEETEDGLSLKATIWGEIFNAQKHPQKLGVKAITYHRMEICKENSQYIVKFVLDV